MNKILYCNILILFRFLMKAHQLVGVDYACSVLQVPIFINHCDNHLKKS